MKRTEQIRNEKKKTPKPKQNVVGLLLLFTFHVCYVKKEEKKKKNVHITQKLKSLRFSLGCFEFVKTRVKMREKERKKAEKDVQKSTSNSSDNNKNNS